MKLIFLFLITVNLGQLSQRLWSSFFPEKQLHGLVPITKDSDMFYWLFPSRQNADKDPLLIWLTGGPGCSSELAVFFENGPMRLEDGKAVKNEISWNNKANLLYIDNPIGTGYSKGGSIFNLPHNEQKIREQMGIFMKKFLELYPELKNRELYISGESYAGHYIPFIADYLLQDEYKQMGVNLQGIMIGNGWVKPYDQYSGYAPFALENKLINIVGKYSLDVGYAICKILVKYHVEVVNQYVCNILTQAVLGSPTNPRFNIYDIRRKCDVPPLCYDFSALDTFLNNPDVQEELGVPGRKWESCNMKVHLALFLDFEVDASQMVANVLNKDLNVLIYNGDKDYICNWRGSQIWVNNLQWKKGDEFRTTEVKQVKYGTHQTYHNFSFYRIFDAGHMVPMDQSEAALEMLHHFMGSE